MKRQYVTKVILSVFLAFSSSIGLARVKHHHNSSLTGSVARGTINVVMGNGNGLVVLTDSMLTETAPNGAQRQLQTPGQKLFQLDSRSVLTIAGFTAAPVPFPELEHTISAILQRYKSQLSSVEVSYHPAISEMLTQLDFIFQNELSLIANIRNSPREAPLYELQLTLAGYDPDGEAKVAWSTVKVAVDPLNSGWLASADGVKETVISGTEMTIKVRGVQEVATDVLDHPERYANEEGVSTYRRLRERRESLNTEEMKNLAVSLARLTAARYAGVGGANQIAVLQHGIVSELDQAPFPAEIPRVATFVFFSDSILEEQDVGPLPPRTAMYIHNDFRGSTILLDGSYFAANAFKNCLVRYRGGKTMFAAGQDVSTSILGLDKNVDQHSEMVSHLIHDFHWSHVSVGEITTRLKIALLTSRRSR